jgi:hypothetical protein
VGDRSQKLTLGGKGRKIENTARLFIGKDCRSVMIHKTCSSGRFSPGSASARTEAHVLFTQDSLLKTTHLRTDSCYSIPHNHTDPNKSVFNGYHFPKTNLCVQVEVVE